MHIKLDDDIRSNRSRFESNQSTHSMSKWILIIAFGLFLGNMAAWSTQRGIDFIMLRITLNELNKQTAIQNQRLAKQRKINAANAKQRQIENDKKQAGLRQAMETCDFWREQYRNDATTQSRSYMEEACQLVNEFR